MGGVRCKLPSLSLADYRARSVAQGVACWIKGRVDVDIVYDNVAVVCKLTDSQCSCPSLEFEIDGSAL